MAHVLGIAGSMDGLRYGHLRFMDRAVRRYRFDRHTGRFTIYFADTEKVAELEDTDPRRREEAGAALMRTIGVIESDLPAQSFTDADGNAPDSVATGRE